MTKKILIVEDESIVALHIENSLKTLGYTVSGIASSGEEAIEKAGNTHPDLVLMDIVLKGEIDGIGAAEHIRDHFDIPVVYLTAFGDENTLQRAKVTEPFGYILKPFKERELYIAIEIALYKHETESKLKRIERWLATTLKSIGDAVIATDTQGRINFMNPVAELLTGWKQEEAVGKNLTEVYNILDEETRKQTKDPVAKIMEEGIVIGMEHRTVLISRDGKEFPIDDSGAPIRNEKGGVSGAVFIFRDISERKRAEDELQKASQQWFATFNAIGDSVCLLDLNGKILRCNDAMSRLLGKPSDDIIGSTCWELIHGTSKPEGCLIARMRETRCRETLELQVGNKWFHISADPLLDDAGNLIGGVHIMSDITGRKHAEEELHRHRDHLEELVKERTAELEKTKKELLENQTALLNIVDDLNRTTEELHNANIRLKDLDRMKSLFIASTSHELRTPLNSIIGFSSIMLEGWSGKLTTEQKEQIQLIHNSGQQLLALINDVIDISKIEAGKIDVYSTEFRLKEVVNEAVATLRRDIDEKGLALSVDVPDIIMHTDRRRLLQCLLNYFSNAVKFTEKGSIALTAKSINNMIDISITDTGIGMREKDIAKLFEPFVRLESPISAQVGGTGLGLYLTKKLVEEVLGGTVCVKSVYGKGSTFSLRIPVKMEAKT